MLPMIILMVASAAIATAQTTIGGRSGFHTDVPRWCGKAYQPDHPSFDPGGQLYPPIPSSNLLLDLRITPRHSIYDSSEGSGAFIVDVSLGYTHGSPYTNTIFTDDENRGPIPSKELKFEIRLVLTDQLLVSSTVPLNTTGNLFDFGFSNLTPRLEPYKVVIYGRPSSSLATQLYTASTELYYLPAKHDGSTVKIDNLHGGMLVANSATDYAFEPFLPLGFYTSCSGYLDFSLANVAAYKDLGFNAINPVCSFKDGALGDMFDWLDQAQLWYQYNMRGLYLNLTAVAEQIPLVKDRPSLLSWYTADEPDGWQNALNSTRLAYDLLRREDPYHPTGLVLNCANYYFEEYTSGADYIMQDAYPVGINATYSKWNTACNATYGDCGCDDCVGGLQDVSNRLDSFFDYQEWLDNWQKPLWSVLQAFSGEGYWSRDPTPEETWAMVILSFNHRAKAIMSWTFPTSETLEAAHGQIAKVASVDPVSAFLLGADPVEIVVTERPLLDLSYWAVRDYVLLGLANLDYLASDFTINLHLPFRISGVASQPWGNLSYSFDDSVLVINGLPALATSFVILNTCDDESLPGGELNTRPQIIQLDSQRICPLVVP